MKRYSTSQIKNIALLGHGGSGKTTLADALLYYGKATERIGKTGDGTTVMDCEAEEKKRGCSLSASFYPLEIGDKKINIIDAPGLFDASAGAYEALYAADSAVLVLSGKSGYTVGAQQNFERAREMGKPAAFFIGKLDSTHAHFYRVISRLTGLYGAVICPVVVPFIEHEKVVCYVDFVKDTAYTYNGITATECAMPSNDEIEQMRSIMLEAVASTDEALMEKYFEGETFTTEEKLRALKNGVKSGDICPVFCGIQQTGDAVPLFADIIYEIMPSANESEISVIAAGQEKKVAPDENATAAAVVFKTVADPFVGKLSFFKVVNGVLSGDTKLKNMRTGEEFRLGKVMIARAGKQEDIDAVSAGDIGVAAKISGASTGDTIAEKDGIIVKPPVFPASEYSMAVFPQNKGDEEKIANSLARLCEEDPTISVEYNNETREQVLSGLGEQHIDIIVSKLKQKFGLGIVLKKPSVAYRETIRKSVKVQGRYKKQSGGHGQFGDVWIEFEPTDSEELVFEEKVFGGAVPKNFFPAVEKGLRDSVKTGVLAGYPMVGIKATLVDGSYHPVDSSEMSFKTAASLAFKDGVPKASPVLLEPIGTLKVITNDESLGDVIGEINKRRGRVIGMAPTENKMQEIVAETPISEMHDFSTAMRSITQGRAKFTLTFERYEQLPEMLAKDVIAAKA